MLPIVKETHAINQSNAIDMCYMNAQKEKGSDSENFGRRITGFGVVLEKIRMFEVFELFLRIFLRLGTFLELFFKFPGLAINSWTVG
jgi:hypothetical protein